MTDQVPMTLKGFEKLRKDLKYLKFVQRPKITYAIAEARKLGDLKENAEYHAAREEQVFCEKKIQEIERKLFLARVIDVTRIPNKGKIIFGSTVTVLQKNTENLFVYTIVGDDEANFKNHSISINSPMARSLIGKKVGEVSIVNSPSGKVSYFIKKIEYI